MMENDGLEKYFINGFHGHGMILDRCDDTIPVYEDKILVVYYKDRINKEPRADITKYNFIQSKTNKPTFTANLLVGDKIKIEPLGEIYTIESIDKKKNTCEIKDQNGVIVQKYCLDLIPYNEQIDTEMKKFYTEKNKKDKEKQESKKLYQKWSSLSLKRNVGNLSSQTRKNIDNTPNLARNVGKSVAFNSNDLYNAYNRQNASPKDTTYNNKIKAQMVTMFFNTFFEHYNNKRISIKPNTLFIICYSEDKTNFLHGRTYEISRENCPRVYTNIIGSIHHQDDKSVITCDELFEIFFKQSTLHIPATHFHVYINVQQKEK